MKKLLSAIMVSTMLFVIVLEMSYGAATSNGNFFKTNKTEISPGDTLEMTLDISKVQYDEFEFKLSSSSNISSVYSENVSVNNTGSYCSISVDKTKMQLNKITLY
ncbi:MAG: hypothetical protein IJR47_02120, partial [Clostridia bacterium]|nr:hypothetical protein [Clostridia bacterium]